MSSRHYEELWRVGVADLVGLLDTEHPVDRAAAPKKLEDWGRLYIRYVQTFRKLCAAHGGMVQPQKRRSLQRTLEACLGWVLELRNYLSQLNNGVDVVDLGEQLAALGLTPDALDLPVPSYFREAREEVLAARAQAAAAAARAATVESGDSPVAAPNADELGHTAVGGDADVDAAASPGGEALVPAEEAGGKNGREHGPGQQHVCPAEAAAELPSGRAAGAEGGICSQPKQQHPPDQQQQGPTAEELGQEEQARRGAAAVAVQAGVRGWLARRRIQRQHREELQFLGMLPPADTGHSAAQRQRLDGIAAERNRQQAERQAELDEALVGIKAGLRQREGFAIKDQIQQKLNDWFLKSRDPESGEYADLPDAAQGGSRAIVHPPPPEPTPEEAAAAAAKAGKASAGSGKQGGGKAGGKAGAAGAAAGPQLSVAHVEGLREAVQEYMDVWQEYEEGDPTLALLPPELQGLPQPKGGSRLNSYDAGMVIAEVRPVVSEELRLEVDADMRRLIQSIKDMLWAEREGRRKKGGKKGKKGSKEGGKDGKKKAASAAGGKTAPAAAAKGGKKAAAEGAGEGQAAAKKKKKKDLTARRTIESIYAELAAAGLVREPAVASVDDFLGSDRLAQLAEVPGATSAPTLASKAKTGGKKANAAAAKAPAPAPGSKGGKDGKGGKAGGAAGAAEEERKEYPEPSLAQARQAVVASCILPLGAHQALAKFPAPHTVLLYGPSGSGKSLLAAAVAHQAGATLFDLSPSAIAGKFPGKQAATMVHMVFKAARALAPSVVLLQDVEGVFVSDKTRAKALAPPGGEPPNRIKKQLVAEVADLEAGDGVLVLCTSSEPQACVKKDERALRSLIQRYIQLPLPDYGGRHTLLQAFGKREGLDLSSSLSLLAQLSAGLSGGQLLAFVQQLSALLRTPAPAAGNAAGQAGEETLLRAAVEGGSRCMRAQPQVPSLQEVALELLPSFVPLPSERLQELREWTAKVHSPLPPEEEPKDGKKGGKKK